MKVRDSFAMLGCSSGNRSSNVASAGTPATSSRGRRSSASPGRSKGLLLKIGLTAMLTGLAIAFAASPAFAAAPVVTIEDAKNVQHTSVDVEGTVNPGGFPTQWRFEYISDKRFEENLAKSQPGFSGAEVPIAGSTTTSETVGGHIENLHAGTTYHLRLFAFNTHGSDVAVASNFTTAAVAPPVVSEVEATEVEYATFTAKGKVEIAESTAAANASTCRFEVATQQQWEASGETFPEPPFGENEAWRQPRAMGCNVEPAGPGATPVEAQFTGLSAGTSYHLRLFAENQSDVPETTETTFETKPASKASVTGPAVSAITSTSAHVAGTVAPNAPTPVTPAIHAGYDVHWSFTCVPKCSSSASGTVEAGQSATEVAADLKLQPALQYTVTLHAVNAAGDETAETTFLTPVVPPDVAYFLSGTVAHRTSTSARLAGLVNPHNAVLTDCHFEYGKTTSYGETVPCDEIPTGNELGRVSAAVEGLTPETTYHFRLVAADSAGSVAAPDEVFRTFPAENQPGCANQAIRAEQHAQLLAECRAWEVVSPLDKNGGNVTSEGDTVVAATNGEAVEYVSRAGFADAKGSGRIGFIQYLAHRGSAGWGTNAISPVSNPESSQVAFSGDEAGVFSEDLSKGIFLAFDLESQTDDIPHTNNLYQEDTGSGSLRTISQATHLEGPEFPFLWINQQAIGASADGETVTFSVPDQLLPEAKPETENLYAWEHGILRLAGVLPDGNAPSEGSTQPRSNGRFTYRNAVSADGSKIAFIANQEGQPQLYLRRNHTNTVWVDEAEGTGVKTPENVELQWMSPDGSKLLFTTSSKLVSGDSNESTDLYLYSDSPNPSAESNLKLISGPKHAAANAKFYTVESSGDVLGATNDASRIYYLGESCECSQVEIMYWDHGVEKQISPEFGLSAAWYGQIILGSNEYPGETRVSSDGLHLALLSENELTSNATNGKRQMYVYDAVQEAWSCASCESAGPTETAVPVEPDALRVLLKELPQMRPQMMSSDGRLVFFTTAAALVPEDINGVEDVYSYNTETGERKLVSSGRGEDGAWFESAGASGRDVFFVTRSQLVGRDTDSLIDLYDARSEGGFAEPPPPPTACSGDGCRGALTKGAEVNSPATKSFSGPGNVHKKVKKHHKRHHKKRHRHHKHQHGAGK